MRDLDEEGNLAAQQSDQVKLLHANLVTWRKLKFLMLIDIVKDKSTGIVLLLA